MQIVGSREARTRLPELPRAVERGVSITIAQRGAPIARLVGIDTGTGEDSGSVILRLKRARAKRPVVSAEEILSARDEGRRG